MDIKEAFYRTFSDDPVNWLKWGIVFAVLVLGYIVALPLYKKVEYRLSWERKRDTARERGHVLEATLVNKNPTGEVGHYSWRATYRYTVDGQEKTYKAYFHDPNTPPLTMYLYYVDTPRKVFAMEEYHYENHKGIILFPLMVSPWILAMLAMVLLRAPLPA